MDSLVHRADSSGGPGANTHPPESGGGQDQVIAYCAQDQEYAEPILAEFTKQTGIRVRAVYDNEAVKTVGLANRLLAERPHPQCDVFWGNEEMRTRQLAAQGVFRETNGWAAVGYRSRRIVINTNQLSLAAAPQSLLELTNAIWRGKVALAYPQFGTTGDAFQCSAPALGRRAMGGVVPGAGGQQTPAGGRQFGGGEDWLAAVRPGLG